MAFNLRRPPKLDSKLEAYPYQLDAVRAVKALTYAAIFHEQGLGKTKIATDLALLWLEEDVVDTVFIVTKKMLVKNWVDELKIHSYVSPQVLSDNRGGNSAALNSPVLLYVMNYEVVSANLDLISLFLSTCRVGVILDESQKIKNPSAKLTTAFQGIAEKFERRIIMTGTPVANRPYDLWSQIKFLDGGKALGLSFQMFKSEFDLPKTQQYDASYADRLSKIFSKIKSFSVRETKETAGIELPNKIIVTHNIKMESRQAAIYGSYRDELLHEFKCGDDWVVDDAEYILKRLLRLVQCASNPHIIDHTYEGFPGKFTRLLGLAKEVDLQVKKIIVWTGFIDNVEWLYTRMSQFAPQKVHGKMAISDRNLAISRFKDDPRCRVLLATPGAAKEGLTLTEANHVVFYDRGFSLDDYLQAQDRIHRISQTEDCFVHNLVAADTIDEWVDVLLNAKHQAAQLAQGDISKSSFARTFNFDLSNALNQVLQPQTNNHNLNNSNRGTT